MQWRSPVPCMVASALVMFLLSLSLVFNSSLVCVWLIEQFTTCFLQTLFAVLWLWSWHHISCFCPPNLVFVVCRVRNRIIQAKHYCLIPVSQILYSYKHWIGKSLISAHEQDFVHFSKCFGCAIIGLGNNNSIVHCSACQACFVLRVWYFTNPNIVFVS